MYGHYDSDVAKLINELKSNVSSDFSSVCQRTDGSIYGTSGQCRKGKEIDPKEVGREFYAPALSELKKRRVAYSKTKVLDSSAVEDYEAVFGVPKGISKEKVKQALVDTGAEYKRILNQMNDGSLSASELKDYIVNHIQMGDMRTASLITVGMEYGGGGSKEDLAKFMSMEKVSRAMGLDYVPSEVRIAAGLHAAKESNNIRSFLDTGKLTGIKNNYVDHQTRFVKALGHEYTKPWDLEYNVGTASLEARAVPAPKTNVNQWPYAKHSFVKDSPEMKALLGSRKGVEQFDDQRFPTVSKKLIEGIKSNKNPNLAVVIAPGKGNESISNSVISSLRDQGYQVKEFSYTWSEAYNDRRIGRIVHLGENRFVYDIGGSISANPGIREGLNVFNEKKLEFQQEIAKGVAPKNTVSTDTKSVQTKPKESKSATLKVSKTKERPSTTLQTQPQKKVADINAQRRLFTDLLEKAKKDRNSSAIRQYQTMLDKLG